MIAFCIIVGDTIPHVLAAIFPSLSTTPFLWLLVNRRAVIILFVLGISYPLSLYRDIAKVRSHPRLDYKVTEGQQLAKASSMALMSMLVILVAVTTQGGRVTSEHRGDLKGSLLVRGGVFQAIGVISFGMLLCILIYETLTDWPGSICLS